MLRTAVLVSGGGTNLQALLDAQAAGSIPHAEIVLVIVTWLVYNIGKPKTLKK